MPIMHAGFSLSTLQALTALPRNVTHFTLYDSTAQGVIADHRLVSRALRPPSILQFLPDHVTCFRLMLVSAPLAMHAHDMPETVGHARVLALYTQAVSRRQKLAPDGPC